MASGDRAQADEQARGRRFFERQPVAHLATADADGVPHVVPICFVLLGDTIYSSIDEKPKRGDPRQLRRIRNVLANPRVAIVADHYVEDWSRLAWVLVRGHGRVVEPGLAEHADAVQALRRKYPQYAQMALEERPMLAVAVERVTVWGAVVE